MFHELADEGHVPRKEQIRAFLDTFLEHFRGHVGYEKASKFSKEVNKSSGEILTPILVKNIMKFFATLESIRVNVSRNK